MLPVISSKILACASVNYATILYFCRTKLGSRTTIIISDYQIAKAAFAKMEMSGRPDFFAFRILHKFQNIGKIKWLFVLCIYNTGVISLFKNFEKFIFRATSFLVLF